MPKGKPAIARQRHVDSAPRPGFRQSRPPEPLAFVLKVPLAKGHWISVVSNKEMTGETWRQFWKYLSLQREITADEEPDPKGDAQPHQPISKG